MIWRLIFVVWVFALLLGVMYYFSGELFNYTKDLLVLDEAGRNRIKDLLEIVAAVLGILGVILAFFAAIWKFIVPEQKPETSAKTVFEQEVRVHDGDFVLGNKTQQGAKDAG